MRGILTAAALPVSIAAAGFGIAARAAADVNSFYDAVHAQGVNSDRGDQALFVAGTQVCKDTAFYIRYGGDWGPRFLTSCRAVVGIRCSRKQPCSPCRRT
jgi:hypothetical protein